MPKHVDHIIDGTELITLKRWGNTRQDVLVSLDDVNASGVISNWANDNLTLTGSRTHETNGNYLQVTTDGLGGFTKSWHITDPTYWNVGFGSTESIYLDSSSMNLTSGGWSILRRSGSEIILNENAQNYDTRIEGQTDANLFFVDASTDRVGIGTNTPTVKFDIQDTTTVYSRVYSNSTSTAGMQVQNSSGGYNLNTNSGGFFISELGGNQVVRIDASSLSNSLRINPAVTIFNDNASNLDLRIKGQTDANLFFVDASTDRIGIGTNTPVRKFHVDSAGTNNVARVENSGSTASFVEFKDSATITNPYLGSQGDAMSVFAGGNRNIYSIGSITVVNIDNNNHDFRIEGQTDANLFFVDASANQVGIGTNTPNYSLHVATTTGDRNIGITTGGANSSSISLVNSGQNWRLRNTPSGDLFIEDITAGSLARMKITSSAVIFNDSGSNLDTRIEGQTDANLFFVDASTDRIGIGTNTPSDKLHVYDTISIFQTIESGGANSAGLNLNNSVNDWRIVNTGSGNFRVSDITAGSSRFEIDTNGNQVLGSTAALATTATDGFTYIPTCAGTPTGTPTAYTGKVPMVYDTTNSIMYVYTGGAWTAV